MSRRADGRKQVHISAAVHERLRATADERLVSVSLLADRLLADALDRLPPLPYARPRLAMPTTCADRLPNRHTTACRCDGRGILPSPTTDVRYCDCPTCEPIKEQRPWPN